MILLGKALSLFQAKKELLYGDIPFRTVEPTTEDHQFIIQNNPLSIFSQNKSVFIL